MVRLFISYSRKDITMVERLRNDLRDAGIEVWIDKVGLTPGTLSWEQGLRDAIRDSDAILFCASPDSRESPYVRDEIALAKQSGKPIYPAWVAGDNWLECVPLGLGGTQYADMRGDQYTTSLMHLMAAIRGQEAIVVPMTLKDAPSLNEVIPPDFVPRNPYRGLRAFTADQAGDFFGRESLITALLTQIQDKKRAARLLAVLGASGSGKSSVMMAGVLPRLKQAHPDWIFLDPMFPGANPLENLTITLSRQFKVKGQSVVRQDLQDPSTRGLNGLARELSDKQQPVVLYIDQFEEIFTLVSQEAERRQFIDLLTTAATDPEGTLILLLSMRADFYDRPLQYGGFGKLIETHHAAVTPLTLADLYDVVQKPAALPDVRLRFEDGLATEMVFAVREEAAALPLLQFTLDQLYEARVGQTLTLEAYQQMGGLQRALARHADATYQALPSDAYRDLARALFLRLIEPGATEQDTTRRRATQSELTLPDAEQTRLLQATADAFVAARLVVSDGDPTGVVRTLEVSHEALIREWGMLKKWLHDAREDLRVQKALASDVAEWKRRGQSTDRLYRRTVLADAQLWAGRNHPSQDETDFLRESVSAQQVRQRHEAAAARTICYAVMGLFGLILVAAVSVALIFAQNNGTLRAEAATLQAQANTAIFEGELIGAQVDWLSTREFPIPLQILAQTPAPGFFATATAQADLAVNWQPVTEVLDGVEMVLVPAGCFWMGSNSGGTNEKPMNEQCFADPFWLDKTEVTQAQFAEKNSARVEGNFFIGDKNPVERITWYEARAYCMKRGGRLPTEAEWEYAARGPNGLTYPWGNEFVADNVVYYENSHNQTAEVGSRPDGASWVGALDMSGNVFEWVSSVYMPYPYEPTDGREYSGNRMDGRVLRGGSWYYNDNNLRVANRGSGTPYFSDGNVGFRCARSQ